MKALAVWLDDDLEPTCLVCAVKAANTGGYPNLFWMINRPKKADGSTKCGTCGQRLDNSSAQDAAEKLALEMRKTISKP